MAIQFHLDKSAEVLRLFTKPPNVVTFSKLLLASFPAFPTKAFCIQFEARIGCKTLTTLKARGPFVIFPVSGKTQKALTRKITLSNCVARAGYALDNVLVYGFVGSARSTIQSPPVSLNQSGYSYGPGTQYMFSNGMFAGLEAARREVAGTIRGREIFSIPNSASLRMGFQF